MPIQARYAHTNLIAGDWRRLVEFYCRVFGCEQTGPERRQHGDWLERGTGLRSARLQGVHLRLPGHGDQGPTLEIFTYEKDIEDGAPSRANRRGLRHLAFEVEDVQAAMAAVLEAGGHALGKVVHREVEGVGRLTFVYVTDPEGNIIELQRWD